MVIRCVFSRPALTLVLLLPFVAAATGAHADTSAATSCATALPKDARAIFDATLPQLAPGGDLRATVKPLTGPDGVVIGVIGIALDMTERIVAERALRAGANGYIMKQEATERVLVALRRI